MIGLTLDFGDSVRAEQQHGRTIDEDWIDGLFGRCHDHGVDTVLWRVSEGGLVTYHSRVMEQPQPYCGRHSEALADVLARFDPLKVAVEAARRHGVRIVAFLTIADSFIVRPPIDLDHVAIDELKERNVPTCRDGQELSLAVDPFFNEHAEYCWTSRNGHCLYKGVPSLAFPQVETRLLDQLKEIVEYEVDGIYLCTRTHSKRPEWFGHTGTEPDAFGYEGPVRLEYQRRYGVDICTENFDHDAWHRLKGEYLTRFLRRAKQIVEPQGQELLLGIKPDRLSYLWAGTGVRTDFLQLYKDWETWSDQGLIDGLVLITDRTIVDELVFLDDFVKSVAPPCAVYPWLNLNGPPCRTISQIERMAPTASAAGAAGIIYHEADDLRHHDTDGDFDDTLWHALNARP